MTSIDDSSIVARGTVVFVIRPSRLTVIIRRTSPLLLVELDGDLGPAKVKPE